MRRGEKENFKQRRRNEQRDDARRIIDILRDAGDRAQEEERRQGRKAASIGLRSCRCRLPPQPLERPSRISSLGTTSTNSQTRYALRNGMARVGEACDAFLALHSWERGPNPFCHGHPRMENASFRSRRPGQALWRKKRSRDCCAIYNESTSLRCGFFLQAQLGLLGIMWPRRSRPKARICAC